MRNNYQFAPLNAPAGEEGGGGGDSGAGGSGDGMSHDSAAGKLFEGDAGSGAAKSGAAGEGKPGDSAAGKGSAAGGGKEGAPAAGDTTVKAAGLLGNLGKKPAAAGAEGKPAGDATPTEHPEDKLQLGDKANPEQKKGWTELKGITKQLRGELTAREVRIKELETKVAGGTALSADDEKLKNEHKAFSDRIAVLDLKSHPDFVKQFTEPKQKIVTGLNAILGDNKVDGVDLAGMLSKPRAEFAKAMSEAAEKLPEYERFEFAAGMRQLYQLTQSEREALGNSSELAKSFQARTLSAQREAFGKTWEKLGGMSEFLIKLEPGEGATTEEKTAIDAYNQSLDSVRTNAEKMAFSPGGEEGVAQTAVKAASFDFFMQQAIPRMEAEYKGLVDLVTKLQSEVKELRGGKGEGAGSGSGDAGGKAETLDHDAAAAKLFSS